MTTTSKSLTRAESPVFRSDDVRWQAVVERNQKADCQFWYSVKTTGVYCRPSCPSRSSRRENVAFHSSPEVAEKEGFRACKRCDPNALAQDLQNQFPKADLIGGDAEYEKLVAKVVGFIEAPQLGLNLPLDIRGTAFQQRVWKELQRIPVGKTASYIEIANRIGYPRSARAVAQACGANSLAVAIPCHRVLRSGGGISGYRWGVDRKQALLQRER
jgi:O-6-methylguanine DNA methyltransferase